MRGRIPLILVAGVLLLGLTSWWYVDRRLEAHRLRTTGVQTVGRFDWAGSKHEHLVVDYRVDGVGRRQGFECVRAVEDCPQGSTALWYDPARPDRFVTASGHTDYGLARTLVLPVAGAGILLTVVGLRIVWVSRRPAPERAPLGPRPGQAPAGTRRARRRRRSS
ncbi:hypothetical protein Cs7R123_43090 [Catellatospora sp. TT07R-123]|uniref:DUF3592 domain-containing protein n=1 Tax=Catellatospora sp. TT07R-123 TaxID=2733863 RepID=UPI001B14A686|nr:DUF3592 domain-containing protein [Catellatospora sp. TT07R-123]GHJ46967.1 hypothetical protein Cs7R123_43090 [Catellatospora sp. TT07R-123]